MTLPAHIVFIPDGNRRWAKAHGKPSFFGHQKGFKAAEGILHESFRLGIQNATIWAGSVDNLTKRDPQEVAFLMVVYKKMLTNLAASKTLAEQGIRVRVLGKWQELCTPAVIKAAKTAMEKTQHHTKGNLTILLGYNGNEEMLTAINSIIAGSPLLQFTRRGGKEGRLVRRSSESEGGGVVTSDTIKQNLYTKDLPPVDLVVRTGGGPHFSNGFMMWDIQNAELYFTDKMWPEMDKAELHKALQFFAAAERRMGK